MTGCVRLLTDERLMWLEEGRMVGVGRLGCGKTGSGE